MILSTLSLPFLFLFPSASAARQSPTPVLDPDAHLSMPVGGLERTDAIAAIVPAKGTGFGRALRVTVRKSSAETNVTQLTVPNRTAVRKGDRMLATFFIRGAAADKTPARIEFLFERATNPWTKSTNYAATTSPERGQWRRIAVPFASAESYAPGEAMASIRFAFGPQTVEIGNLQLTNFGGTGSLEELIEGVAAENALGNVTVAVNRTAPRQTIMGLGGNFCQPRYGHTEALDAVGRYTLANLKVAHARVGLPLNNWTPEPGVYRDDAQARASMLALQELAKRKIPTIVSIWEGPLWMLGGSPEQSGRVLAPDKVGPCIDAIVAYLKVARDKYGVQPAYLSFNEPDYGVNFKFSPGQMADFIRAAGPRFKAAGIRTKFVVGDTANGGNFYDYARPLLADKTIAPYLGPLAFHSWDSLGASDASYQGIAKLSRQYKKAVWCLEAGHDAQLWQAPDPWGTWENALRTAMAYERTIRLSGASVIDYWTYQDNYPLVDSKTNRPYPVFRVIQQLESVFRSGWRVIPATSSRSELQTLATVDPKTGSCAVLIVNPSGNGKVSLTGLPTGASLVIAVSDRNGQDRSTREFRRVDAKGRATINVPTRSVVIVQAKKG